MQIRMPTSYPSIRIRRRKGNWCMEKYLDHSHWGNTVILSPELGGGGLETTLVTLFSKIIIVLKIYRSETRKKSGRIFQYVLWFKKYCFADNACVKGN
jgi:hypothetical protein